MKTFEGCYAGKGSSIWRHRGYMVVPIKRLRLSDDDNDCDDEEDEEAD